jgi:hypothetical protein
VDGLLRDKNAAARQEAAVGRGETEGIVQDSQRVAAERNALEYAVDGESGGDQPVGRSRAEAASG